MKRLIAKHDIQTRNSALAYIDGKFIQCYDHAEAVMEYLNNKGEDVEINNRYEVNDVMEEHNIPFACMHIVHSYPKFNKDKIFPERVNVKAIYIEENTLNNITLDELVPKIKAKYPNYEIFLEDGYLENWDYDRYEKLGRLIKKSEKIYLKDILKPWDDSQYEMIYDTDYHNRDNAFIIVDGKLYENETHEKILNGINSSWLNDVPEILGSILTGVDGKKYIAIYKNSAYNMTIEDAIPILKNKYPNAIICTDPMNDIDETAYMDRIAGKRLIKKAGKIYLKNILDERSINSYGENTDYGNRDFAIAYIDNKIYIGATHKDIVEDYLIESNLDSDEYLDFSDGFVTEEEQESIDLPMAFASYIKGKDGKDYIAIYSDSIFNVDINDFINKLKNKYPNAIICEDNNDRYMDKKNVYIETI